MNGITIERISHDNLNELEKLYMSVYNNRHSNDYYFKKYNTSYTAKEYIGYLAFDNEHTPAGHFSVIPCLLQYENKMVLAAQAVDGMVSPRFRSKRIFTNLFLETLSLCKSEGIQLVFGFPNQNSYSPMIRAGWKEIEKMSRFTISIPQSFFSTVYSRISFLKKEYDWDKQAILQDHILPLEGLTSSVLKDGYGGVIRSDEYLKYRKYNKTIVVQINDSRIWLKINKSDLVVGDIEFNGDKEGFDWLIKELIAISKKIKIRKIHFQTSGETELYKLFANKYEAIPSFPILFWDFDQDFQMERFKFTFADVDSF